MWQTFGHNQVKNILDKQLAINRLPHAYLFVGPGGVGKKMLAMELAAKILNTKNLNNHPDFQILDIDGEITMEPLLDFTSRLGFKPFAGEKKVAIINNAENFNTASGNALLKILEEPSQSTVIILIAGQRSVLPTIASRCQLFNFNFFNPELLKKFAEEFKLSANEEMFQLAFGSPAKLKRIAEDKDFFSVQKKLAVDYQNLQKSSLGERLSLISEFSNLEPNDLEQNLLAWFFAQNAELNKEPENFGKARAILEALLALKRNQNKKLILQGLMLKI